MPEVKRRYPLHRNKEDMMCLSKLDKNQDYAFLLYKKLDDHHFAIK